MDVLLWFGNALGRRPRRRRAVGGGVHPFWWRGSVRARSRPLTLSDSYLCTSRRPGSPRGQRASTHRLAPAPAVEAGCPVVSRRRPATVATSAGLVSPSFILHSRFGTRIQCKIGVATSTTLSDSAALVQASVVRAAASTVRRGPGRVPNTVNGARAGPRSPRVTRPMVATYDPLPTETFECGTWRLRTPTTAHLELRSPACAVQFGR
jgi:hypothetical protein